MEGSISRELVLGRGGGGGGRDGRQELLRGGEHLFGGLLANAGNLDELLQRGRNQLLHGFDPRADELLGRGLAELEALDLEP